MQHAAHIPERPAQVLLTLQIAQHAVRHTQIQQFARRFLPSDEGADALVAGKELRNDPAACAAGGAGDENGAHEDLLVTCKP